MGSQRTRRGPGFARAYEEALAQQIDGLVVDSIDTLGSGAKVDSDFVATLASTSVATPPVCLHNSWEEKEAAIAAELAADGAVK